MNSNCEAAAARPLVIIRADAGKGIGFGHFVRSCALAGILKNDFDCRVVSFSPDSDTMSDYQLAMIAEAGASPMTLKADSREHFDEVFLQMVAKADVVVLDNYYYSTQYQLEVKRRCGALVCVDDMHNRHMASDMVITFCPLRREDFSLEPSAIFHGGLEWSFLRAPFLAPALRREWSGAVERVVLSVGGADPLGLTDKMIDAVWMASPEVHLDVMAGQTVKVGRAESNLLTVWRQINASQVAALFDASQLGIFPASTVCVEAFSRRLPVAAGHFVDNQEEFYAHGVERGWFAPLGCLLDSAEVIASRLAPVLAGELRPEVPDFDFEGKRRQIVKEFMDLARKC